MAAGTAAGTADHGPVRVVRDTTEILPGVHTVDLEAGRHGLRLEFLDHLNNSRIHLYWTPPDEGMKVVPSDVLFPFGQVPAP